jgi:hypothetical protein
VVLTPRCWRQVRGTLRGRRWQESPVAGESTKETVKTIARGMPGDFRCDLTNACALYHYHCTRGYRAHRAPGIPCALFWAGATCTTRALRAAGSRTYFSTSLRGALATKQSILSIRSEMDCFACARNDGDCLKIESNNKHTRRPGLEPGPIATVGSGGAKVVDVSAEALAKAEQRLARRARRRRTLRLSRLRGRPTRSVERGGWGLSPRTSEFSLGTPTPTLPRKSGR